jgi:hypothetical protein
VKHWEIIADNLSKAGWSWGCISAIDSEGRTIWIADAHRDDGKRLVVHPEEKLTAFVGLESVIRALRRIVFAIRRDFLQIVLDELSGFLTNSAPTRCKITKETLMKQTNLLPSRAALLTALCLYSLAAHAQDATWLAAPLTSVCLGEGR